MAESSQKRVLVVEDSSSMRSYIANLLETLEFEFALEIVEAASGFEALKVLPHHRFDLILTDINMPDINGLELVSFLKNHQNYRGIPVVVISTERAEEDQRRAHELGAEAYLVKPFQIADLVDKVNSLLRGPRG